MTRFVQWADGFGFQNYLHLCKGWVKIMTKVIHRRKIT